MPLTKAQCPNCGGALEVDASKEAAVCPFCNTPYIVEKAINNYTTNITNNIQANTVIVQGTESEFEIERVTLKKYLGHNKNVTIPDYIEIIDKEAFEECSFITSVTIPDSVTSIEEFAFFGCTGLTSITIPDSVTCIERYAFCNCSGLTSITIPDSVTEIGWGAFKGCTGLTSVTIPDSVTTISEYAFYGCTGLTSVTIGNGVTSIGDWAFYGCTGLTDVNKLSKNVTIHQFAFSNTPVENQFSKSSGGCYVATCVYGSYDCPQVWTLRRYRDDTLASTWYGRAFIRTYYAVSPTLVKWFGETKWFKKMWQGKLDCMVKRLNDEGVENTPYQDRNW